VSEARNFVKISKNIPLHLAATLCINPTTAYRMLKDFVSLEKGEEDLKKMIWLCEGESVLYNQSLASVA